MSNIDAAAASADEPLIAARRSEPDSTSPIFLPRTKSFRRYNFWLTVVMIAFSSITTAIVGITLPNHLQMIEFGNWFTGADAGVDLQKLTDLKMAIDAGAATATAEQTRQLGLLAGFEAARATSLGIVVGIATIFTMLAQPIVGFLSDRTRSRLGRRAPWILYGALVGALLLAALRFAPSVAIVAILWTLAQVALVAGQGPVGATVADRVPSNKLGSVSSWMGLGGFIGGVLGGIGTGLLFSTVGLNIYIIVGAVIAAAAVVFVLIYRDSSSRNLDVPKVSLREATRGFLVPLKSADFRWVWIARVLLFFGNGVSTALSLYMLQSYIQPAMTAADATRLAPLLASIGVPFTLVVVVFTGKLSDKVGRRKPFVFAASALMAISFLFPLAWPTLPAIVIQGVLSAIAFGMYLPVDGALFVDVLPDRAKSAGRDLGIAAIATSLGAALGPLLAAGVVSVTGRYELVWVFAFVLVALAAVAILRVRRVR